MDPQSEKLATTLEEALLGVLEETSPPLDLTLPGGVTTKVCFKRIPDYKKQILRTQAAAWVEDARRRAEAQFGELEIREGQVMWEELRDARWEILLIQAAMRDATNTEKPAATLRTLELGGSSDLFQHLGIKYREFEQGLDVDAVTGEQIQDVIEIIKKNDLSLVELWQRFGFATLAGCLLFLVGQQTESATKKS